MNASPASILFVCLGNICRSPLAEGIMAHLARTRHPELGLRVDSAGTGSWHVGEPPDRRSVAVAAQHGVRVEGRARQAVARDLDRFDLVVAMDRENLRWLEKLRSSRGGADHAQSALARIVLMRDFDPRQGGPRQSPGSGSRSAAFRHRGPATDRRNDPDVPDPYYGGPDGFEEVYRILERCCEALLEEVAGGGRD